MRQYCPIDLTSYCCGRVVAPYFKHSLRDPNHYHVLGLRPHWPYTQSCWAFSSKWKQSNVIEWYKVLGIPLHTFHIRRKALLVGRFCLDHVACFRPWQAQKKNPK